MIGGGFRRDEEIGPRRLVVPSSVGVSVAIPMFGGLVVCLRLPPAAGIPLGVVLALVGAAALLKGLYPAIVSLDEEGFTIDTFRSRVVLWADCSPFTVVEVGAFTKAMVRPTPPDTVYFTDAAHGRRHRLLSSLVRPAGRGNNSYLPPKLGGLEAYELASLFNRYRDAYGRTANAVT